MLKEIKLAAMILMGCAIATLGIVKLYAQNGLQASQLFFDSAPGPLASCPAPTVGRDKLCDVAGVGFEQSLNGGPYAPLGAGTAPVTSVNGKKPDSTGNVALAATTTIQ
jgi:hypothetical protein